MDDAQITLEQLIALRRMLGFNQATMAEHMGLSKSAYVNIEIGFSPFRKLHALAAERAVLRLAIQRDVPKAVPYSVLIDIEQASGRWGLDTVRRSVLMTRAGRKTIPTGR